MAKIDYKLRRMDSDNQFVAQEVNGGIRTIDETVNSRKPLFSFFFQVSGCIYLYFHPIHFPKLAGATLLQSKDTGVVAG